MASFLWIDKELYDNAMPLSLSKTTKATSQNQENKEILIL